MTVDFFSFFFFQNVVYAARIWTCEEEEGIANRSKPPTKDDDVMADEGGTPSSNRLLATFSFPGTHGPTLAWSTPCRLPPGSWLLRLRPRARLSIGGARSGRPAKLNLSLTEVGTNEGEALPIPSRGIWSCLLPAVLGSKAIWSCLQAYDPIETIKATDQWGIYQSRAARNYYAAKPVPTCAQTSRQSGGEISLLLLLPSRPNPSVLLHVRTELLEAGTGNSSSRMHQYVLDCDARDPSYLLQLKKLISADR